MSTIFISKVQGIWI